jgi:hypothetical protein
MAMGDDSLARLRGLIDELTGDEAESLLAEARAEARDRVRATLTELFAQSLLDRLSSNLEGHEARAAKPSVERGPSGTDELAWYVYGVMAEQDASYAEDLPGIEASRRASAICEGALAAVVSNVEPGEFAETRLREHLSDLTWVEATARAHEHTLEQLRRRATVIPMRMCTVYRTEDRVREMLRREEAALREGLEKLEGKTEWGVKVLADPRLRRSAHSERPSGDDAASPGGTGTAYMERRRHERDAVERAGELMEAAAAQIHERLRATAADGLAAPLRPTDDDACEMILNGVYLVRDAEIERFHACIRELQDTFGPLGLELEPTGPWPAYNFVPGAIGAAW